MPPSPDVLMYTGKRSLGQYLEDAARYTYACMYSPQWFRRALPQAAYNLFIYFVQSG